MGCSVNAHKWNRRHPVGTKVRLTLKGQPYDTETKGAAWSLSTGRAVVPLAGIKGSVLVDSLQVIDVHTGATP
jgi:hypothetical protein